MENITLSGSMREILGKKVKTLRSAGQIPAVLYGKKFKNLNLVINEKELKKIFADAGSSTIVELVVDNQKYNILIHEPQKDPVTDNILHVDLYKVDMTQEIHTEIPLNFIGTSPAVEDLEGNLITNKDALEVKCLPDKLVSEIPVDISILKTFTDLIKAGDLNIPEGIEVLADKEEIVAQVTPPRSEEELEEMEKEATADVEKEQIETIESEAEKEKAEKEESVEGEEAAEKPSKAPAEQPVQEKNEKK